MENAKRYFPLLSRVNKDANIVLHTLQEDPKPRSVDYFTHSRYLPIPEIKYYRNGYPRVKFASEVHENLFRGHVSGRYVVEVSGEDQIFTVFECGRPDSEWISLPDPIDGVYCLSSDLSESSHYGNNYSQVYPLWNKIVPDLTVELLEHLTKSCWYDETLTIAMIWGLLNHGRYDLIDFLLEKQRKGVLLNTRVKNSLISHIPVGSNSQDHFRFCMKKLRPELRCILDDAFDQTIQVATTTSREFFYAVIQSIAHGLIDSGVSEDDQYHIRCCLAALCREQQDPIEVLEKILDFPRKEVLLNLPVEEWRDALGIVGPLRGYGVKAC